MTSGLEDSRLLVYLFSHIYKYNTVPVKPSRGFFLVEVIKKMLKCIMLFTVDTMKYHQAPFQK